MTDPIEPADAERERRGAAAEAGQEQQFADFRGGSGPAYEAMAAQHEELTGQNGAQWPEAPWRDGERMHGGDRLHSRITQPGLEPEAGS